MRLLKSASCIIVSIVFLHCGNRGTVDFRNKVDNLESSVSESDSVPEVREKKEVFLFYPSNDYTYLGVEVVSITKGSFIEEAKEIVSLLFGKPKNVRLSPVVFDDVGSIYVVDGIVYVDVILENNLLLPLEGVMSVYSIVNSILYNLSVAEKVVITFNGRQSYSIGGHIFTGYYFIPRFDLLSSAAKKMLLDKEMGNYD